MKKRTVNEWCIILETQKGLERAVIRRWVNLPDGGKKYERLPIGRYKHIQSSPKELHDFVLRLNQSTPNHERSRKVIEIRHAFISPELLDSYFDYLEAQIPTPSRARYEFSLLKRYFLNFFINNLQIVNPVDWHKVHETEWAKYLSGKETPASANTKQWIIHAANRFMVWLHKQRPNEVPALKFNPLSKAKFKMMEAKRVMREETRIPQYISNIPWREIESALSKSPYSRIRSSILLAYHYGLRRAETLGLQMKDIRKGYLSIERQLEKYSDGEPSYGPLKGRETRKVPHWSVSVGTAYSLAEGLTMMHPDTLTDIWNAMMDELHYDYTIHDIRHTWITNQSRLRNIRDVQMAAGHVNIQTTMGYLQDDRQLEDQPFIPKKSS